MNYTSIPELLAACPDTNIIVERFKQIHPDMCEKYVKRLYKIVDHLRCLKPKNSSKNYSDISNMDLIVEGNSVSGIMKDDIENVEDGLYSLKLVPWKYWLAMTVKYDKYDKTINDLDVIIHCIWEMTFMGCDDDYCSARAGRKKG